MGEDLPNLLPVGVAMVSRDYAIEAINTAAMKTLSIPSMGVGQGVPYAEVRRTIDETFREGRVTQAEECAVEDAPTSEPSYGVAALGSPPRATLRDPAGGRPQRGQALGLPPPQGRA